MVMGKTAEPDLSGEHKVLGSWVHPARYIANCSRIYNDDNETFSNSDNSETHDPHSQDLFLEVNMQYNSVLEKHRSNFSSEPVTDIKAKSCIIKWCNVDLYQTCEWGANHKSRMATTTEQCTT